MENFFLILSILRKYFCIFIFVAYATPLLLSYIDFIIAYSSKLIKAGID